MSITRSTTDTRRQPRVAKHDGGLVVMVQARLGSERLPGKVLFALPGGSVLEHCLRSLRLVRAQRFVVVTEPRSASSLGAIAEHEGFELFVGSEADVLGRFADAVSWTGADTIVRATADAPLVSAPLTERIVRLHHRKRADLSHYLGMPLGTGVEVIAGRALHTAANSASDPFEREHITQHFYRNPNRFRVVEAPCPRPVRDTTHVTIDDDASYALVQRIFAALYRGQPIAARALVRWLRAS
jgi:spore coat polysaccharide biosynthesis protein SpsF